jgi:hypothetical protein
VGVGRTSNNELTVHDGDRSIERTYGVFKIHIVESKVVLMDAKGTSEVIVSIGLAC